MMYILNKPYYLSYTNTHTHTDIYIYIPRPSVWVSNFSPKRSGFGGFLGLKFQTRLEDSGIYIFKKSYKCCMYKCVNI